MNFNYQVVKPKDLSKIDSRNFGELLWWSYNLGVTLEKLVTVVDEVGESAEKVKNKLFDSNADQPRM
jgi:Protein of unknown function (DUF3606)